MKRASCWPRLIGSYAARASVGLICWILAVAEAQAGVPVLEALEPSFAAPGDSVQLLGAGFKPLPGVTPIIPVILGDTATAIQMSDLLLDEGVFVTGFGYPVVPKGQARVRCQVSAGHSREDLDQALTAFRKVGAKLGLI